MRKKSSLRQQLERILFCGVALVCITPSWVRACESDAGYTLNNTRIINGVITKTRIELQIAADELKQAPRWVPGESVEPLPLHEAYQVLRDYILAMDGNVGDLQNFNVKLKGCPNEIGFRYFDFNLSGDVQFAVLFNRVVIETRVLEPGEKGRWERKVSKK